MDDAFPPGINPPGRSVEELLAAGIGQDRNHFTRAGRALQKHLNRSDRAGWKQLLESLDIQELPTSASEYNRVAQILLDHIINNLNTVWISRRSFSGSYVIDARLPNGFAARWDDSDSLFFRTFLDR